MSGPIRWVVDVVLVLLYIAVLPLVAVAVRLVRDPLSRRRDPRATSYWTELDRPRRPHRGFV